MPLGKVSVVVERVSVVNMDRMGESYTRGTVDHQHSCR